MSYVAVNVSYQGHNLAGQVIYAPQAKDCNPLKKVRKTGKDISKRKRQERR
jgi:hypothetical protein